MPKDKTTLKKQAQEFMSKNPAAIKNIPPMDIKQLIEDLQVHQIELEMQNEELRSAQTKLEDARDGFSDLYDFAPVGYFTFNKKGIILEVNLTGAKLLEIERSHLIKVPFTLYVADSSQETFYLHLYKVDKTKKRETCELILRNRNGATFDALLESMPVQDSEGNFKFRTAISDITQRKQAEKDFLKLNEELEQRVTERTAELEKMNEDLERTVKAFTGREIRMIELKGIIKDLEEQLAARENKSE
jgi:chemotaxis family two-component system sensor kinase Cph1